MPHKHNAAGRHHIPKTRYVVMNWREYEAGLRRRGNLTLWITEAAINTGRPSRLLRRQRHSDLPVAARCIQATAAPGRRPDGLGGGVLSYELAVPDHSTVSRRAAQLTSVAQDSLPRGPLHVLIDSTGLKVYGAGEWLLERHDQRGRRAWSKLHLAVDADSGQIVAAALTDQEVDNAAQVGPLLEQIEPPTEQITADGAYDRRRLRPTAPTTASPPTRRSPPATTPSRW